MGTPVLPDYVAPFKPVPQVTPFTYRDGNTMLKKLTGIIKYINLVVVPFINTNFEDLGDAFEEQVNILIEQVNAAIEAVINDSIDVQDPVVAALIADLDSDTSNALDLRYALKSTVDAINDIIATGRLSTTSLNAAYAAKSVVDGIVAELPFYIKVIVPRTANHATALNADLAASTGTAVIRGNFTVGAAINVPDNLNVIAYGSTLLATHTGNVVVLGTKSGVEGITVNGGDLATKGITAASETGVSVRNVSVRDINGPGIDISSCTDFHVTGSTVTDVSGQGIQSVFSSDGSISDNLVTNALHGIQFWGGDAAVTTAIGCHDVTITGNVVRNVTGGVWGSLGDRITIQGNTVETASDVGVDFEGCINSTMVGNTVKSATNGSFTLFYKCNNISIVGNTTIQTGAAHGVKFNGSVIGAHTNIVVADNVIQTATGNGIDTDDGSTVGASITGNRISTTSGNPITERKGSALTISNNTLTVTSGKNGLIMVGTKKSVIIGNQITSAADASSGLDRGGIRVIFIDSTANGQDNIFRDNVVVGFAQALTDDCSGNVLSHNLWQNNTAANLHHWGVYGSGYYGYHDGNRAVDPTAATTVVAH